MPIINFADRHEVVRYIDGDMAKRVVVETTRDLAKARRIENNKHTTAKARKIWNEQRHAGGGAGQNSYLGRVGGAGGAGGAGAGTAAAVDVALEELAMRLRWLLKHDRARTLALISKHLSMDDLASPAWVLP